MSGASLRKTDNNLVEELVNAAIHGIGLILATIASVLLVDIALNIGGDIPLISALAFGTSMILVYLSSTLFHSTWNRKAKRVFLALDHCTIFLLIAGTYTPLTLMALPPNIGIPLCIFLWAFAILAIFLRIFLFHRLSKSLEVMYLIMAWCGMIWGRTLYDNVGLEAFELLTIGAISYTIGLYFYFLRRMKFNHAVWHVLTIVGSGLHFWAIAFYILPGG